MPFTSELVATTLTEAADRHADDKKVAEDSLLVVIGPEGGFVIEEVTQATARGARLVSLGSRILRMETAAIYAAVVFNSSLSR
jgi:RsmE family RNA methyltransferase